MLYLLIKIINQSRLSFVLCNIPKVSYLSIGEKVSYLSYYFEVIVKEESNEKGGRKKEIEVVG